MDYLDWMTYGGLLIVVLTGVGLYWQKKAAERKSREGPDDRGKAK